METTVTELIEENKNLIYSMTHYFNGYNYKDDLFQVGCIGLMKAYKNFKDDKNVKFTTYAYPYILGEMKKQVREDKSIKISRDLNKLCLKVEKSIIMLSQKLMREPTTSEISRFLEIPEELVVKVTSLSNKIVSIDEPVNSNGEKDLTLHEVIPDDTRELSDIIDLKEKIKILSDFEKQIIKLRYYNDLTQSETANIIGTSQVQVSRKEKEVLQKLREALKIQ